MLRDNSVSSSDEQTYDEVKSLLCFWGEAYLQLLTEYSHAIEHSPDVVHEIDPATIFPSHDHGILGNLEKTGSYQRHIILNTVEMFTVTSEIPPHRCLPRNTGRTEGLLLEIDKKRNIMITIDKKPGNIPRLYCQDLTTERRLQPVADVECIDGSLDWEASAIKMSPDSLYLAVIHYAHRQTISYTTVWSIEEELDFNQMSTTSSWAKKILSLSSAQCFFPLNTFDEGGFLYCPQGRINLQNGKEQSSMYQKMTGLGSRILSDDGKTMMLRSYSDSTLSFVRLNGDDEQVHLEGKYYPDDYVRINSQYGVWASETAFLAYNMTLHKIYKLLDWERYDGTPHVHFNGDGSQLYIIISCCSVLGRPIVTILVWSLEDSTIRCRATYKMRGRYIASWLDSEDEVLHLIVDARIWIRLLLLGNELVELEPAITSRKYNRVEHNVSDDGTRLAIMHLGEGP
jgi:hypothetical protein